MVNRRPLFMLLEETADEQAPGVGTPPESERYWIAAEAPIQGRAMGYIAWSQGRHRRPSAD